MAMFDEIQNIGLPSPNGDQHLCGFLQIQIVPVGRFGRCCFNQQISVVFRLVNTDPQQYITLLLQQYFFRRLFHIRKVLVDVVSNAPISVTCRYFLHPDALALPGWCRFHLSSSIRTDPSQQSLDPKRIQTGCRRTRSSFSFS